jgi:hypothetical protein
MHYTETPFGEAKLYIGSVRGYKGPAFSEAQLTRVIQDFQTNWNDVNDWTIAVRITKTNFVCMDYTENGWEIAGINYPRFPRTADQMQKFFKELQEHLMIEFGQNRMTVTLDFMNYGDSRKHSMAEREDAEQTHR